MKSIIVDKRIDEECERSLLRLGFNVIKLPALTMLGAAIESHPDSLFFRHKKQIFAYSDYVEVGLEVFSDIREYHRELSLNFVSETPKDAFPGDCALNALVMGDILFARKDSVSDRIIDHAKKEGLRVVNVRQGYPACATLALGAKHAVTADRGLHLVFSKEGIESLLISEGDITLPPYEYGFIGGSSFVYGSSVYFFGDLDTHRDSERIKIFLKRHGFSAISLAKGVLRDLGGAVILE